jgi:hypothetical protein
MKLHVPRRNQGMTMKQILELSIVVVSRVKTHYSAVCRGTIWGEIQSVYVFQGTLWKMVL